MTRLIATTIPILALMLVAVSCAPATEPDASAEPRVEAYEPYYELSVDGRRIPRAEDGWAYQTDAFRLRLGLGPRTPLLSTRGDYGPARIQFTLHNESGRAIELLWDRSSMVLPGGATSRVAHRGVRAEDVHRPSPPTVVPPSAHLDDFVVPAVNVSGEGGWTVRPFVREDARTGTTFRLYLTLVVEGEATPVDLRFTRNERVMPLSN